MKVSIIIRTYNRAYIIGEAIESALNQTYANFEIIVVDDGSTDGTAATVKKFRSDKVRYIRHDRNRGVSAAGNTGIKAANGDIVAHLDSDDLWKPEMLSSLVDVLRRHRQIGAVFCDVEVDRGRSISSIVSSMRAFPKLLASRARSDFDVFLFSSREMYLCLLEEVPIKPTAVLIRRTVLDEFRGYNESWCSGEDWELYLRISKHHGFGYVDRKLAVMRVLEDSTLSKLQEEDKSSLLQLAVSEKKGLRRDREALEAANRAIARHCKDLGWIYLHSGRRMKSISTYARGFAETGHVPLVMRAGVALMPLSLTAGLKKLLLSSDRSLAP
ncbi:glycosyltransferase [Bradyrhizobium sp. IC3069]|uniref:glycosyltransferase family 2 protein n=1 Tax=Bradyrhizobium TaxID=374 RepID=UPI001CD2A1CB|nr:MULTISPECIES: glycosyltransferase [Bradyrhizobium]MCA1362881.1 glycosyltransferase [Bradyrhizobium sp. IC4059]MCA1436467.1 glycosyltransferase [Bradyrhizobium sp. BRP20]MCA1519542.1 glycosyltransferase [Bradyrhizobium sp. IC3069]MCA1523522.1 glycosyltransferase [Bradyrhizobium yuanmingense]MCA1545752.1 glycosyltransferase [Bradyrhizobium sp. BRP19]